MNRKEFRGYKGRFLTAIREALREAPPGSLDEAAFPAYSHPNPLINFLFWERIYRVMRYLERESPYGLALDFGCGSGVMLPFLAQICTRVVAVDVDLAPLKHVQARLDFPANLAIYDARAVPEGIYTPGSFDIVLALDVLEHVEDLDRTLEHLCSLLKPGGRIVISGPTENLAYRLGRALAGPEYSGDYHVRSIYDIRRALSAYARVQKLATLFYPIPLFEVYIGLL
ncbi:MAG: class I SAM-dependent methyltransferase [Anaerolineae bacterium]|nr:MAG: class I SAM-dependent methyltransferase [Anaerolineae bacterium]